MYTTSLRTQARYQKVTWIILFELLACLAAGRMRIVTRTRSCCGAPGGLVSILAASNAAFNFTAALTTRLRKCRIVAIGFGGSRFAEFRIFVSVLTA